MLADKISLTNKMIGLFRKVAEYKADNTIMPEDIPDMPRGEQYVQSQSSHLNKVVIEAKKGNKDEADTEAALNRD